jgi:hypothetical protein
MVETPKPAEKVPFEVILKKFEKDHKPLENQLAKNPSKIKNRFFKQDKKKNLTVPPKDVINEHEDEYLESTRKNTGLDYKVKIKDHDKPWLENPYKDKNNINLGKDKPSLEEMKKVLEEKFYNEDEE